MRRALQFTSAFALLSLAVWASAQTGNSRVTIEQDLANLNATDTEGIAAQAITQAELALASADQRGGLDDAEGRARALRVARASISLGGRQLALEAIKAEVFEVEARLSNVEQINTQARATIGPALEDRERAAIELRNAAMTGGTGASPAPAVPNDEESGEAGEQP